MKKVRALIQDFVRRDPGLALLAGCGLLAALFWQLPVPAFLFADGGSGSSGTSCSCSVNNCKEWALGATQECTETTVGGPWEACTLDENVKVKCPTTAPAPNKKMPYSRFKYEKAGAAFCNNVATHPVAEAAEDVVEWVRDDVAVTATGSTGTKKIEFKPKLRVEFPGFSHGNVCQGSTGQIDIVSAFYAAMSVCGQSGIEDSTKGETGWAQVTHTFKLDAGTWKFTAGSVPHTESFNISKDMCACAAEDDPDQVVAFSSKVTTNSGVTLGKLGFPPATGDGTASVLYYCDDDTTTCTAQN